MPSKRTPSIKRVSETNFHCRSRSSEIRLRHQFWIRSGALDPHLLQRLDQRGGDGAHLLRADGPDAATAERLDPRELDGIKDVAARAHLLVEGLERVAGIR